MKKSSGDRICPDFNSDPDPNINCFERKPSSKSSSLVKNIDVWIFVFVLKFFKCLCKFKNLRKVFKMVLSLGRIRIRVCKIFNPTQFKSYRIHNTKQYKGAMWHYCLTCAAVRDVQVPWTDREASPVHFEASLWAVPHAAGELLKLLSEQFHMLQVSFWSFSMRSLPSAFWSFSLNSAVGEFFRLLSEQCHVPQVSNAEEFLLCDYLSTLFYCRAVTWRTSPICIQSSILVQIMSR